MPLMRFGRAALDPATFFSIHDNSPGNSVFVYLKPDLAPFDHSGVTSQDGRLSFIRFEDADADALRAYIASRPAAPTEPLPN